MRLIKPLLSVILILVLNFSMAQRPGGGGNGSQGGPMKPGVAGKIKDAKSREAVAYASVALYKESDSSLVTGAITKEDGRFFIAAEAGNYYIKVNFMGYKQYIKSNIVTTEQEPMAKVGMIKLQRALSEIEGVEIVGSQSYVEYKIDRKIVNVGRDIGATGGSAVEALENVPSVTVDIEGNVELRGSSNFTVLINGKPSPLSGSEALEQIPTSVIKNIEIITNPSAKYDPDGMSGIINVILKEDVKQGLNGRVEASAGSFGTYGLNAVFNYRKNKINYFVGADIRKRIMPGGGQSELINFASDTNMLRSTELDRRKNKNNYTFRGGFDFYANDNNTISIEGAYGINDFSKDYISNIYERTEPATYELYTISDNKGARKSDFYKGSITWQHKFKREGESIEAYAFINNGAEDKSEDQRESFSDANWTPEGDIDNWFNTMDTQDKLDVRFKLDYTLKLKKDKKFEAGAQARNLRNNSVYVFNSFDTLNQAWYVKPDYGNDMKFEREIYSAYATYGGTHKNFGYQFGLRGEYTHRLIESTSESPDYEINRFDIFPTIHLSQKVGETNSVLLSYSRRIDRPGGWELGPNPIFISSNFIRVGNPELDPEYTDNYELSYQKTINKSFISVEAYYKTTKNKISRLQEMDSNNVIYMTYDNLDKDQSAGLELMTNFQFYKWFRLNLSGSYYYYKLLGNISSGVVEQQSNNFNLRADLNFMITPLLRFQVNGFYRGPSVTAQGNSSEFFMVNSALRYDLFKRKVTVTFQVKDVFSTMRHEFDTYTSTFNSHNAFYRESPSFKFTMSYKINNYRQERKNNMNENGEGGDDI